MKENIDRRKLARLMSRADDVRGIYVVAQERWQSEHAKSKELRSLITQRAQPEYQEYVAGLNLDELKALPREKLAGLPVSARDVEDLVFTLERAANARKKAEAAGAESNAFSSFVNDLKQYAGAL